MLYFSILLLCVIWYYYNHENGLATGGDSGGFFFFSLVGWRGYVAYGRLAGRPAVGRRRRCSVGFREGRRGPRAGKPCSILYTHTHGHNNYYYLIITWEICAGRYRSRWPPTDQCDQPNYPWPPPPPPWTLRAPASGHRPIVIIDYYYFNTRHPYTTAAHGFGEGFGTPSRHFMATWSSTT